MSWQIAFCPPLVLSLYCAEYHLTLAVSQTFEGLKFFRALMEFNLGGVKCELCLLTLQNNVIPKSIY